MKVSLVRIVAAVLLMYSGSVWLSAAGGDKADELSGCCSFTTDCDAESGFVCCRKADHDCFLELNNPQAYPQGEHFCVPPAACIIGGGSPEGIAR